MKGRPNKKMIMNLKLFLDLRHCLDYLNLSDLDMTGGEKLHSWHWEPPQRKITQVAPP